MRTSGSRRVSDLSLFEDENKVFEGVEVKQVFIFERGGGILFYFFLLFFFSLTCKTILFNLSLNEAFQIGWERIFHNFTQRCSEFLPSLATLSRILELQVDSTERSRDQHSHNASLSRVKSNVSIYRSRHLISSSRSCLFLGKVDQKFLSPRKNSNTLRRKRNDDFNSELGIH